MDVRGAFRPVVSALRSILGLNGVASEIHEIHRHLGALGRRLEAIQMPAPAAGIVVEAGPPAADIGPCFVALQTADGKMYELSVDAAAQRDAYHEAIANGARDLSLQFLNDWVRPSDVFFDLGANIGTVSIPVAMNGATVHAFEMLDANVQHLARSVHKNSLRNISIILGAVSDHEELVGIGGVSAWGMVQDDALVSIPGVVIDIYARRKNITTIDVMKIDVEGSEMRALAGAAAVIARDHPDIVIECNALTCGSTGYSYRDILRVLEASGYSLYRLRPARQLWPWSSDQPQEVICADYLATMKSPDDIMRRGQWSATGPSDAELLENIKVEQKYSSFHNHYLLTIAPYLPQAIREDAEIRDMIEQYKQTQDETILGVLKIGAA